MRSRWCRPMARTAMDAAMAPAGHARSLLLTLLPEPFDALSFAHFARRGGGSGGAWGAVVSDISVDSSEAAGGGSDASTAPSAELVASGSADDCSALVNISAGTFGASGSRSPVTGSYPGGNTRQTVLHAAQRTLRPDSATDVSSISYTAAQSGQTISIGHRAKGLGSGNTDQHHPFCASSPEYG
jgi:hypothetical protein